MYQIKTIKYYSPPLSDLNKTSATPMPILKIPPHTLTPYNAQATLFFQSGFWSLYLPVTVAGRVSDIWRSYFSQALFKRIGVDLGFLPRPVVVQDRNPHSHEADFNAEIPLYIKSSALISHLLKDYVLNDNHTAVSFVEILESLWVDMFERNYIEKGDVENMQQWIDLLLKLGYQFPSMHSLSSKPLNTTKIIKYDLEEVLQTRKKLNGLGRSVNKIEPSEKSENINCDNQNYNIIFGSSDLHDGSRTSISSVLANLKQTYIHVSDMKKPSNYPELLKLPNIKFARERPSYPVRVYSDHSKKMKPTWVLENLQWYSNHGKDVNTIDAFICSFPASMCQLWSPMNKTIIFLPAHRYNLGRCSVKEWRDLNKNILEWKTWKPDMGHTIGGVSRYDVEYVKYYTGINAALIPSYSGFYINSSLYKGDKKELLIFSYAAGLFIDKVTEILLPEFSAKQVYDLYKPYTPEDLGRHRAVITLPYSVMSYRHTELYALGIPLFAPSIKFYMGYFVPYQQKDQKASRRPGGAGIGWDRTSTSHPYCRSDPMLEQKMRPKNNSKSIHPYSPNVDMWEDVEAENYWLQFADFYDWPHIQYFDSYEHLKQLLLHTNFTSVHELMTQEHEIRRETVVREWCSIIKRISNHKKHP